MNDYGHIDDDMPSFAISLYKEYRGLGIGTALMKEMRCILKNRGYKQASLAVQKANYAVRMYQKTGFVLPIVPPEKRNSDLLHFLKHNVSGKPEVVRGSSVAAEAISFSK